MSAKGPFLLLLLALVATCHEENPSGVSPTSDGGYAGAPGRNVISPDGYFGALGDGATGPVGTRPIGGGSGGTGGSSQPSADARRPDRPADRPAMAGCSLIRQDCGAGRGCYPAQSGSTGICQPAGALAENTQCLEHDMCAPGHLCVDVLGGGGASLCEPICDPLAAYPCPGNRTCQTYAGTGYCRP